MAYGCFKILTLFWLTVSFARVLDHIHPCFEKWLNLNCAVPSTGTRWGLPHFYKSFDIEVQNSERGHSCAVLLFWSLQCPVQLSIPVLYLHPDLVNMPRIWKLTVKQGIFLQALPSVTEIHNLACRKIMLILRAFLDKNANHIAIWYVF